MQWPGRYSSVVRSVHVTDQATFDLYTRAAWPVHRVDGDTADFLEDDGRRSYTLRRERMLGINTPELHASDPDVRAKAQQATDFMHAWLIQHLPHNALTVSWPKIDGNIFSETIDIHYFLITSSKPDAFDRWLCILKCQSGHD